MHSHYCKCGNKSITICTCAPPHDMGMVMCNECYFKVSKDADKAESLGLLFSLEEWDKIHDALAFTYFRTGDEQCGEMARQIYKELNS